jgi:hypothetical protein
MASDDFTGGYHLLADLARTVAVGSAEAALSAVLHELISITREEDDRPEGLLTQDAGHAGAAARPIDAYAQSAARRGAEDSLTQLQELVKDRVDEVVFTGEETGTQTRILGAKTLIIRVDPLDGTTNALNLLQSFSAVATVDYVSDPTKPPRHLGGAILGGEFDISWANWSRPGKGLPRYARPLGKVYVRAGRLSDVWLPLELSQEERDLNSVASVAASRVRFDAYAPFRDWVFRNGGVVYHLGGNPFCAALLLGHVGAMVETQWVTLHDSAYLIPHWLLGGSIDQLLGGPLDYIGVYEQGALIFEPGSKPVPPFVAYYGNKRPLSDAPGIEASVAIVPALNPQSQTHSAIEAPPARTPSQDSGSPFWGVE